MKYASATRMFWAVILLLCSSTTWAANSVFIGSASLSPGATGVEASILLENDVTLRSLSVPLAIRNVEGGAFVSSLKLAWGDRLTFTGISTPLLEIQFSNIYLSENGTCKDNLPGGFGTIASNDTLVHAISSSPTGVLYFRGKSVLSPLAAGADATGSLRMIFDITSSQGVFEIDTTCTNPANHPLLVQDITNTGIIPDFTKGVMTVGNRPIARDTSWSTNENTPRTVTYLPASDGDGDPLQFSITAGPENGSISGFVPATGAFEYTPNAAYFGEDSLSFEATDGNFISNTGKVRITVIDVNDPPVARDTAIVTDEDVAVDAQLQAYDTDTPVLTYERLTGPTHGSITAFDASTGAFTYLPNPNYFGSDAMTFRALDGITNSNPGTVSITVNPINDPPVARDTVLQVAYQTAVNARFQAYDVDGPSFTFTKVSGPSNGTFTAFDANVGTFTYTPNAEYFGPDSIKFTADDGSGPGNTGTVRINVSSSDCICAHWADPSYDGEHNVQDMIRLIQNLFENYLPSRSPKCPVPDADYNCDCFLDVLDLVKVIDHLFAGDNDLCDPCASNCYLP